MLDPKFIRNNVEAVQDSIDKRNIRVDLARYLELDRSRLEAQQSWEELKAIKNKVSKEIPTITDAALRADKIAEMKGVSTQIEAYEQTLNETKEEYEHLLYSLPNLLDPTAAIGPDEDHNAVEYTFGTPRAFDFEIKTHYEIAEARGWLDMEKAADISGARFWYLKGDLALLQLAVINYAVSILTARGFEFVIPPYLVREKAMYGTGFFPADKNEIYHVNPEDDNLYLIGTSEVPLTSYHADEIMDLSKPKKYVGYSSCFRREAGSYGKDMKGILRGHQFDKVEMVCFARPSDAAALHDEMVATEEYVWQSLGIPYQKINICSGDLGNPAMKKYDLEAWMPGQQKYREVTSCSNVGSFQTRRLSIRTRLDDGEITYAYSLNGTVVALSRCLITLIENYQNEDMSVTIPEVLRPFMGGREKI
jgi:seryl-tRNA synthetase